MSKVTGLVGGASKFFEGRKMQRKAEGLIKEFEWEDLESPFKDVQVSTLGAYLRAEEASRNTATAMNTLRSGGTRAIVGGVGRVQENNNIVNREIAAGLDQQQKNIDLMEAQDRVTIRGMKEKRQADELQGYGQMMNTGMNMRYQGIADLYNTFKAEEESKKAALTSLASTFTGGAVGSLMGGGNSGGGSSPFQTQPIPTTDNASIGQGIIG